MDITHRFQNEIKYDLTVNSVSDRITLKMEVKDLKSEKTFEKVIKHDDQIKR